VESKSPVGGPVDVAIVEVDHRVSRSSSISDSAW
jgi:hypothetical protein